MSIKSVQYLISLLIFTYLINVYGISGIEGGNEVTDQKIVTFLVSFQNNSNHTCGASIIDNRHILTAAHCLLKKNIKYPRYHIHSLKIVVQTLNLSSQIDHNNIYSVDSYYFHSKFHKVYKPNKTALITVLYDIAIVKIQGTFNVSADNYLKIGDKPPTINSSCTVYGWGRPTDQKEREKKNEKKLHSLEVVIQELTHCIPKKDQLSIRPRFRASINNILICSSPRNNDTSITMGDSGGPLICNNTIYEIHGIISTKNKSYDMFTNVPKFKKWISAQINYQSSMTKNREKYKYQVLIREKIPNPQINICNGILIDYNTVVAATNCLSSMNISNLEVNIFDNISKSPIFINTYTETKNFNNLMNLKLVNSTNFNSVTYPNISNKLPHTNTNCTILTWSHTQFVDQTDVVQYVFHEVNIGNPVVLISSTENEVRFYISLLEKYQNYEFIAGAPIICNDTLYGILENDYLYKDYVPDESFLLVFIKASNIDSSTNIPGPLSVGQILFFYLCISFLY